MKAGTILKPNIQLFASEGEGEGGTPPNDRTYTQEELDNIVNERTGKATKTALSSFFKGKGLTQEEADSAIAAYLDNKKKNTPDPAKLQGELDTANTAKNRAVLERHAVLEAVRQGVDVKQVEYVLKLANLDGTLDSEGKVNAEKLTEAVKKVLEDIPALKASTNSGKGFHKIGSDGKSDDKTTDDMFKRAFGLK